MFTTKESLGTGLGALVTKELVKKHNGSIRVRSRVGAGTVFSIWLPPECRHHNRDAAWPVQPMLSRDITQGHGGRPCPCLQSEAGGSNLPRGEVDQNRYTRPADGSAVCVKVSDFSAAKPKSGALYTKPRYSKRSATFLSEGIG